VRTGAWFKAASRDLSQNKFKYLMVVPVIVYFVLFCYKPMYGLIIAFQNYRPNLGFYRSPWVGFRHFINFFNDVYFFRLIRNTISLSFFSIIFGFPAPILLALCLNELRNIYFKRTIQTITYMPYFISMIVVCSLIRIYSSTDGIFSQIAIFFGGTAKNYLTIGKYFLPIYVVSGIWQTIGWNTIIFLAAITGIDQEQYEAATIDGAGRFRRMLHVTLPNLLPIIMVLFILRMGSILNVGFEKIILLYNSGIYEASDVISSYVYRRGILEASFSFASAVGLFNSLVNILFLVAANQLSKRFTEFGLY